LNINLFLILFRNLVLNLDLLAFIALTLLFGIIHSVKNLKQKTMLVCWQEWCDWKKGKGPWLLVLSHNRQHRGVGTLLPF